MDTEGACHVLTPHTQTERFQERVVRASIEAIWLGPDT